MKTTKLKQMEEMLLRYPALVDLREPVIHAVDMICTSHRAGGKVLTCGNGGSASDSEHIVGELMKGFILPRRLPDDDVKRLQDTGIDDWRAIADSLQQGISAVALTGHPSLSTAVLNDNDPLMTFAQQVYVLGKPGDILIALSTSGNSKNVVKALKVARAFGVKSIGLVGSKPCAMDDLCNLIIKVPATETFKVQEYHLPIYHTVCIMVEEEIFG